MATRRIHDFIKSRIPLHEDPNQPHYAHYLIVPHETYPDRYRIHLMYYGRVSFRFEDQPPIMRHNLIVYHEYITSNPDIEGGDIQHELKSIDDLLTQMEDEYQELL